MDKFDSFTEFVKAIKSASEGNPPDPRLQLKELSFWGTHFTAEELVQLEELADTLLNS